MKEIAVVTGASSGLGREFVRQVNAFYPGISEVWCIGRDFKKLKRLGSTKKLRIKLFSLDLTKACDLQALAQALKEEKKIVRVLVNGAGSGYYGPFSKEALTEHQETVRLNCEALTAVTYLCLPYLKRGSRVIQIASAAAFFPQPDFAVYAASKTYVLSLSRALSMELRERGISVTAVCPGPVDTPFLKRSRKGRDVPSYKKNAAANPRRVVRKALLDSVRKRGLSIYGKGILGMYLGTQLLPQSLFTKATYFLNKHCR